jgi:uncharacterized protein (TIGR03435 family)
MFERYNEPARRALFFSRYEASQLGSQAIEPEHLLFGVLREARGAAGHILAEAGLRLDAVRGEILARVRQNPRGVPPSVEIPFSPATKHVLSHAAEEADRLLDSDIGPEHLLLGLLREENSVAAVVLAAKGVRLDTVREWIVQLRNDPPHERSAGSAPHAPASGVHISRSGHHGHLNRTGSRSSVTWTIGSATLRTILSEIYGVSERRIDLPDTLDDDVRYDIVLALGHVQSVEAMARLMQDGIERKFNVAITRETREVDVYAVTAPSGSINAHRHSDIDGGGLGAMTFGAMIDLPELTEKRANRLLSAIEGHPAGSQLPIKGLSGSMSMHALCEMLERFLGRPVVDDTNITGTYDIDVRTDAGTSEGFLEALRDRIGLVVTPSRRSLPILAVRRA